MENNPTQSLAEYTLPGDSCIGSVKKQRKSRCLKAAKKQKKNEDLETPNPNNEECSKVLPSSVNLTKTNKSVDVEEFVKFREAYLRESKDKPFTKCNVLEKFVMEKNLNYVIIPMFPDEYEVHCNVGNGIQKIGNTFKYSKNHQQNFIATQQLPKDIYNMLKLHGMVYESYVIAKVEKYLSRKEANPVLYNFIMLQEEGENSKSKMYNKDNKKKKTSNKYEIEKDDNFSFKSRLPYLNMHRPFAANKSLFKNWYYDTDVNKSSLKIPCIYKEKIDKRLQKDFNIMSDDDEDISSNDQIGFKSMFSGNVSGNEIEHFTPKKYNCSHRLDSFICRYDDVDGTCDVPVYRLSEESHKINSPENAAVNNIDNQVLEDLERGTLYINRIYDVEDDDAAQSSNK